MTSLLAAAGVVIMTAFGHVIIRHGITTTKSKRSKISIVLLGNGSVFIATILGVFALREMHLKVYLAITSSVYALTPALSVIVLKERITTKGVWGIVLILSGILLFSVGYKI